MQDRKWGKAPPKECREGPFSEQRKAALPLAPRYSVQFCTALWYRLSPVRLELVSVLPFKEDKDTNIA